VDALVQQANDEFKSKTANMNEQQKQFYFEQGKQFLDQKYLELINFAHAKVNAAIREIAEAKGLKAVVDSKNVFYGGQDITNDVLQKMNI